jgi:molybdate transport system permease protein
MAAPTTGHADNYAGAERDARTVNPPPPPPGSGRSPVFDTMLYGSTAAYGGLLVLLLVAMVVALLVSRQPWSALAVLGSPDVQFAIGFSLVTCTVSALLALIVAVPVGYVLARRDFPGRRLVDTLLDVPIVLPPLVVGLALLILFSMRLPGTENARLNDWLPLSFSAGGVVLAQFVVGAAFAVRAMRATFDELPARPEQVALVLGASPWQAFSRVTLPAAGRGCVVAFTLAWARAMGEFGPILVFAGATRQKTEVLATTVFLELSVGELERALVVSLLMVALSLAALVVIRLMGTRA